METKIYPIEKIGRLNLQELYITTNDWLSDMEFFDYEVQFFKKVIRKYFTPGDESTVRRIGKIQNYLFQLEMEKYGIRTEIVKHREVVELLIESVILQDETTVKNKHSDLEIKVNQLYHSFREFKMELFKITEEVIQ